MKSAAIEKTKQCLENKNSRLFARGIVGPVFEGGWSVRPVLSVFYLLSCKVLFPFGTITHNSKVPSSALCHGALRPVILSVLNYLLVEKNISQRNKCLPLN